MASSLTGTISSPSNYMTVDIGNIAQASLVSSFTALFGYTPSKLICSQSATFLCKLTLQSQMKESSSSGKTPHSYKFVPLTSFQEVSTCISDKSLVLVKAKDSVLSVVLFSKDSFPTLSAPHRVVNTVTPEKYSVALSKWLASPTPK